MIDLEKARSCAYQTNYHLIWATKYRRKVLLGSVKVRLDELLKTFAEQNGCRLLAARVHDGDHVHVFVSARPKVSIFEVVRVFNCISAKVFFVEFSEIESQFWGGHLWLEGYAVRTAGELLVLRLRNTSIENKLG